MGGILKLGRHGALLRLLACSVLVLQFIGMGCDAPPALPTASSPATTDATTVETPPGADGSIAVKLVRVVDGDTIVVEMPGGAWERVRYIGVDAPEFPREGLAGECLAAEARAHNEALLRSGALRLRLDTRVRDDYGRILAYVWAGDVFVNHRLVLDGFAKAGRYPPNLAHQSELMDAQEQARRAGVGVWGCAGA